MRTMKRLAMLTLGMAAAPLSAQTMVYWPAPTAASSAQTSYFPVGTPLRLTTRTQVSTKDNKPGDRIDFAVASDLVYRGQVVVPAGALAVGEVADLQRNGHFGKKGKLGIRLLYVQTPSGPVRLTGRGYDEGRSGTAVSLATIALAPIAVAWVGIFVHGTSAILPSGTPVDGYLAEDLRFAVRPAAAQVAMNRVMPDGVHVAGIETAQR